MRAAGLRLAAALALFAASACGSCAEVIDDVLGSLSRGVSFLERQHEHINLDGAVGFVLLQGRCARDDSRRKLVRARAPRSRSFQEDSGTEMMIFLLLVMKLHF